MPRITFLQTNFAAGELSPRLHGRVDVSRYQSGCKTLRNAHPLVQGGALKRAGWRYMGNTKTHTSLSRLIPFIYSASQAYALEFGDLYMRVWKVGGQVAGPYEIVTPYTQAMLAAIDFTQSADTILLFHKEVATQKLVRLADDLWTIGAVTFEQQPTDEQGLTPATTGTLSSAAVGSRTLTAGAAAFLASDVGRQVTSGVGVGTITGFTSTTVVTVNVTTAFSSVNLASGAWTIEGTPQTTCTPSAKDPVGATITLTLAADGWRAGDVGAVVRINGGSCLITAYTSALIVNAEILTVLNATTAAAADAWTLEQNIWSAANGYAKTGTFHDQRLIMAGPTAYPTSIAGSRTGLPFDFTLGTLDSDAFLFEISADQMNPIEYVSAMRTLVALSFGGEFTMQGGVEKPLTPTNVQVRQRSNHGSAAVRPVRVGREELFAQRGGRKLLALSYNVTNDDYESNDLTTLAEHMTQAGIADMSWQEEPDRLLWVALDDGTFLSLTLERAQEVLGWARHDTDGEIESLCSIPSTTGDVVFAIVKRTIGGATKRYVELMEADLYVDSAITGVSVPGATVWTGLTHLEGKTVKVWADGVSEGSYTVTGGQITLSRAAFSVQIGLPFTVTVDLLDPEMQTGMGSASGNNMRTSEVTLRVLNTSQCKVNDSTVTFRQLGPLLLDQPVPDFTGLKRIELLGFDKGKSEVTITHDEPLSFHLLSVTRKLTVND